MSRHNPSRFITGNRNSGPSAFRKCCHHRRSHHYANHLQLHDSILNQLSNRLNSVEMNSTINAKILFHFLAPTGSYDPNRVLSRAHDVIMSLNDDFNNYTSNGNTMNNFRYKSVINQVFLSNMEKQRVYLGKDLVGKIPTAPSNITFELGEIYYYPIRNRLNLSSFDDERDIELEFQMIKQFIQQSGASAIRPENFINIWIVDMLDTHVLGFSNFPWEALNGLHGIILNRRVFFPEDYGEGQYHHYKVASHQMGHYFGLVHEDDQHDSIINQFRNINEDVPRESIRNQNDVTSDPSNQALNKRLHQSDDFHPMFMNFMGDSQDKFSVVFTGAQLRQMRLMIQTYRPRINTNGQGDFNPPEPKNDLTESELEPATQVPRFGEEEGQRDPRSNAHQNQVTNDPNGTNGPNDTNDQETDREQIISNIQNNISQIPQPPENPVSPYQKIIDHYRSYNSDNGYAHAYPYDPYTAQQYNQHMSVLGSQHPSYTSHWSQYYSSNHVCQDPKYQKYLKERPNEENDCSCLKETEQSEDINQVSSSELLDDPVSVSNEVNQRNESREESEPRITEPKRIMVRKTRVKSSDSEPEGDFFTRGKPKPNRQSQARNNSRRRRVVKKRFVRTKPVNVDV